MKKILYIAFLLIGLASCNDFLDITPTGKVIPTTLQDFRAMITSAYLTVPHDRGLASFRSDEFDMSMVSTDLDLSTYKDIWTWTDINQQETTISFSWMKFYQVLFLANYTIESKDVIEQSTSAERSQLVGECYMLRAYMHFLLVNLFADPYGPSSDTDKGIPLKLNSSSDELLSRNTVAEVYESILDDLNTAQSLLNVRQWEPGLTYRFNTLSVDAFRSRVYLYMGKWSEALSAAERVLEQQPALADLTSSTSYILPNHYTSPEAIVSFEQILTSSHISAVRVSKSFYELYQGATDLRRSKFILQPQTGVYQVNKGGSIDFRCSFRVGEQYLNGAEAALQQNTDVNINKARTLLLSLMEKRYTANAFIAKKNAVDAMNNDQLLQEIYDERARELAFEGHRWFDLRRTTRPRLQKTFVRKVGAETFEETFVLEQNDVRYTIPIPSEAIAVNPNLVN